MNSGWRFISEFSRRRLILILAILALITFGVAIYLTFYYSENCQGYDCFQSAMEKCIRASYANEEPEATWKYNILGSSGNKCDVQVTLLQVKKGELGIDKYNGESMTCSVIAGTADYPEKDMSKCTGKLKEDLQSVQIEKLFKYIIANLGQINQSLSQV